MAIQYAGGTIISASLTQSAGTRAELAQWVRDQLVLAGWTSSGSATDYQLTGATTPQGLACRVRSYDPGSGSCARLKLSNTSGTKTQAGDLFLLPAASKTWRIIANKYQFFVFTPGGSAAREFACGGVPYLPTFLTGLITEAFWGQGNATSDGDATARPGFRMSLSGATGGGGISTSNQVSACNGNVSEINAGAGINAAGAQQLYAVAGANWSAATSAALQRRWHDDSLIVTEPLIGWGLTSPTDENKVRGQLWDAAIVSDSFAGDANITLDSRTYWAVTNTNGGVVSNTPPGTLFVAVT